MLIINTDKKLNDNLFHRQKNLLTMGRISLKKILVNQGKENYVMTDISNFQFLLDEISKTCKFRNKYYLTNIGKIPLTDIQLIHPSILYEDGLINRGKNRKHPFGYGILVAESRLSDSSIPLKKLEKLDFFDQFEKIIDKNGEIRFFLNVALDKSKTSKFLTQIFTRVFNYNLRDEIVIDFGYWTKKHRLFNVGSI